MPIYTTAMSKPRKPFRLYKLVLMLFLGLVLYLGVSLGFATFPIAMVLHNTGDCPAGAALSAIHQYEIHWKTLMAGGKIRRIRQTPDGLQQWTTPMGDFWAPEKTWVGFVVTEQLLRIYGDGPRRVQPGDVVIDCGANIGTFTREALLAGASKVVAVEPSPQNVECLRRTFKQEIAAGKVHIAPVGVWDKDDKLVLTVFDNSALDSFVMSQRSEEAQPAKPRTVEVAVTTVDKLAAELKLDRVDFIKMDIEGAERNALRGAAGIIRQFRPRMSIATENLDDDYLVVPKVIAEIDPKYRTSCGRCATKGIASIRPDVLFFQP